MQYLLFSYPNCPQCEALKEYLQKTSLEGKEYNLTTKESKMKIRDYLDQLNRDKKGAIVIPTLVIEGDGRVLTVVNTREELHHWLKSKD
ncbi:hypothetical protein KGY73_09430 [bacterium]|nr:hypothetical protein [bacterium]